MWGQPKRSGKSVCGHRGQCSCQRRINAQLAARPELAPRACGRMCQPTTGQACGKTMRGGVCPCNWCP